MKRRKKECAPVKPVVTPFIEPPAKREPLRAPLIGSALLGGKALGVVSAPISGAGAVLG